jgi:O-antigen/teichoic acid export membrane protein
MGSIKPTAIPVEKGSQTEQGASLRDAKARIPKNVLWNSGSLALGLAINFLITPLLVHRLGSVQYGIWALIGELLGYSFLLDFGIRIAVTRYVARHIALNEGKEVNEVVTTGLAFTLGSAATILAIGVIVAFFFPTLFQIPHALAKEAGLAAFIVAAGMAVGFPGSLFNGCVAAVSRYDLLSLRNVAAGVLRALLLWFFLSRGYALLAVALITCGVFYFAACLDFILAFRQIPALQIRRTYLQSSTMKTLAHFSFYAFILSIAWRLLFLTDNLVVGFVLGPAAVTFYSVGMQLASVLRDSLGTITTLFAPLASQMDALNERESLRALFVGGSRIGVVYGLAGIVGLTILGPRFLGLWMGESFVTRSGPILILLSIETGFYVLAFTCGQVLYGVGRHKVNAWLSLTNATANFALSATLVRWWGPVGVAWGTVIPAFAFEAIILPVFTARLLGVSLRQFYWSAVVKPVAAALPYAGWLWAWREHGWGSSYTSLVLVVGSGLLIYGPMAWVVALDARDKNLIRRWLGKFGPWIAALQSVRSAILG